MDRAKTSAFVDRIWNDSIVPTLVDYIRIPNQSPHFDKQWQQHGHMDRATELIAGWCKQQPIEGLQVEVVRLPGRTPLIYMEIPGHGDDTVMLYGHLDKQPEMTGWLEGLGPWKPVLQDDKLYGRGGADDGYAAFASLTAIRAVKEARGRHARCVVLIEACEESGSYDLPFYIDHLAGRIGKPSLVVCLDSGCANYDQLWCTTSLRGIVNGDLVVEIISEGVHSGDASGVVPSTFRILRQLLDRVEDSKTGKVLDKAFWTDVPPQRLEQARAVGAALGTETWDRFPWLPGTTPVTKDPTEAILNRTWRPQLAITGADGLPELARAGNVLRPKTAVKVSLRIPPTLDPAGATETLRQILTKDPPYGARVAFHAEQGGAGWNAPALAPWLEKSAQAASQAFFGKPSCYMGEGGSIPFMGMLGLKFPQAQFLITGVLGPGSNAHGPNEFLHIPTGKRLTCCVAQVLEDHCARGR